MLIGSPRTYAAFGLACLAALSLGQDRSKPITYTTTAVSVKKALAEISQKSGVTLEAATLTANQIIAVRVKDVPLQTLMDKIAYATDGVWESTATGFRLVRDNARVKAVRDAQLAAVEAKIRESIAKKTQALAKEPAFDAATAKMLAAQLQDVEKRMNPNGFDQGTWQQQSRIQERGPGGRALSRLLPLLNAAELAGLPTEAHVVYSNAPTKMERQLGNGASAVLDQFAKEHAVWAEAMHDVYGDTQPNNYYGYQSSRKPLKDKPAKVLLIVNRWGFGSSLNVQMMIGDSKGRIVADASTQIEDGMQFMDKELQEAATNAPKEDPIQLSDMSQRMVAAFQKAQSNREGFPLLDADIKTALLNPETRDPLSFIPSEAAIQTGERRNENVVAAMPDILFFGTAFLSGVAAFTPSMFVKTAQSMQTIVEEGNGWLILRPQPSVDGHLVNGDRAAVGRMIRSIHKEERLSLAEASAYALKSGSPQEDLLGMILAGLIDPSAMEILQSNWHALKLYALLTPPQMQTLKASQPMSLRNLSPEQRQVVTQMVYGTNQRLSRSYRQPMPANGDDEGGDYWNTLEREATEALPNGIPDTGTLTAQFMNNEVVFLGAQTDPGGKHMEGRAQTMEELANQLYMQERPDLFPWIRERKISADKLRVGTQLKIEFAFSFTPETSLNATLTENAIAAGAPVSLANLPENLKKKFDAAMEQTKKNYANVKPGQFTSPPIGGGSPPPP